MNADNNSTKQVAHATAPTVSEADLLRDRSIEHNVGLADLREACASLDCPQLHPPFRDVAHLSREQRLFNKWDFAQRPFRISFRIGERANPFHLLQGEEPLTLVLQIGATTVAAYLKDTEQRSLSVREFSVADFRTTRELSDALHSILKTPPTAGIIDAYLGRWESLCTPADTLRSATAAIARALGSTALDIPEIHPHPFHSWLHWIRSLTSIPPWIAALATIALDDDHASRHNATLIAANAPAHLRLTLEWALLFSTSLGLTPSISCVGFPLTPAHDNKLRRLLRALAPPDQPLPLAVTRLAERLARQRCDATTFESGLGHIARQTCVDSTAPHCSTSHNTSSQIPFRLQERLAELATLLDWSEHQRTLVLEAIVATEVTSLFTLAELTSLATASAATPEQLAIVLHIRAWCTEENFGWPHRDKDDDHVRFSPPSYQQVFAFIDSFSSVPDHEEAVELLAELIDRCNARPSDLELLNSLPRTVDHDFEDIDE